MTRSTSSSRTERATYSLFGLSVASALPLPELHATIDVDVVDVEITLGPIPPDLPGERDGLSTGDLGALLRIPGVGRYLMTDGSRITVDRDPAGSLRHLRLYLLGSAFGALLHQRRLLPLHANAIVLGGRTIAFMGASGAGKSTMAAWFHDRGHIVLADDVCVVTRDRAGAQIAHPGIPRLRLWRDALEASGRSAEAYEHAFDDADKYNVPTMGMGVPVPTALAAVYLLDPPGAVDGTQQIRRLAGVEAVEALMSNTYRGGYASMLSALPALTKSCVEVATQVPIFAVRRVWGRDQIDTQLSELEQHAATQAATTIASLRSDIDQPGFGKLAEQS